MGSNEREEVSFDKVDLRERVWRYAMKISTVTGGWQSMITALNTHYADGLWTSALAMTWVVTHDPAQL